MSATNKGFEYVLSGWLLENPKPATADTTAPVSDSRDAPDTQMCDIALWARNSLLVRDAVSCRIQGVGLPQANAVNTSHCVPFSSFNLSNTQACLRLLGLQTGGTSKCSIQHSIKGGISSFLGLDQRLYWR